ncbi:DUF4268 domain-containing protein [Glycomyces dulcitolivorans]|uniref:DUF4268 domain-containing protein n=1 Tax=Glycomyces dulcitolivorans TaxID=2200759 RepID=UPI000DD2CBFE|nr:DUF4268 domain-containing protein [Glycomyces dulcitolivorans]
MNGDPLVARLEAVDLREIWHHEAHHFTPWLLNNADALAEALGMELELEQAEHPVGDFSLDLIGTDAATGDRVIIENQLADTDHGHLGQLLTYAAGTDAAAVVWIARNFREEHRRALDWLNERTDSDTRFFGVAVRVWRIGDSAPALQFNVVAAPNDWGKRVRSTAAAQQRGEGKRPLYLEFWEQLTNAISQRGHGWCRPGRRNSVNWIDFSTGAPRGTQYGMSFTRDSLRSELYLHNREQIEPSTSFERFLERREALETHYGSSLEFEALEGRKASRIADYRPGSIEDTDAWPEFIDWFIDAQRRLRAAVETVGKASTPSGD